MPVPAKKRVGIERKPSGREASSANMRKEIIDLAGGAHSHLQQHRDDTVKIT
jgi:hypothetical protein